jgi:hypothetical protein
LRAVSTILDEIVRFLVSYYDGQNVEASKNEYGLDKSLRRFWRHSGAPIDLKFQGRGSGMDLDLFRQLVVAVIGEDSEGREQATSDLVCLQTSDLALCLKLLWHCLFDSRNPFVQKGSTLILFHHTRNGEVFLSPPLLEQFWARLIPQLPPFLAFTDLPAHIRNIVMDAAALACLRAPDLQEQLVAQYRADPSLESFVLHAVGDMIRESGSLCGIELGVFLEIFASPVPGNAIPRFSLFFAIATLVRDAPELHDLFPSMLELATSDLEAAIRIVIDFCEMTPLFLANHVQALLDWVCPIIYDRECESRGPAIMILTTLACEAPILCRQSAIFYPMAMTCLLDVMTEITDAAPLIPDVSESEPWQLATDAFASIMRDAEGFTILGVLFDLRNAVFAEPTWNSIHAIFAATSVASPRLFASILVEEEYDELSQFMQPLVDIAFDQDGMPRLRAIALQALTNLFRSVLPGLDKGMLSELPSRLLHVIRTEHDSMIQYFAIDAFNTFLTSVPRHSFDMEFYELIVEGIQAAPAD